MNVTEPVSQPADAPEHEGDGAARVRPGTSPRRHVLRAAVSIAVAIGLLTLVVPRLVGTTLHDVGLALGSLTLGAVALLTLVWAAGIFVHSFVLTGALPGLTRSRALTLNLTGSAVSNVFPFGGSVGVALNYVMIRAWGVGASAFAAFTLVTNLWVTLIRLVLPAAAVGALLATGTPPTSAVQRTAIGAAAILVVLVLLLVVCLAHRPTAVAAAQRTAAVVDWLGRPLHRQVDRATVVDAILDCRDLVDEVLRDRWAQLSLGMFGYTVIQAFLLWACVHAVGGQLTAAQVLAGFAVERVLTLAVVTPGATGIAEAGTIATMVALGGDPVTTTAGVLLFRAFSFALEIPVGGVWLGGWFLGRRLARQRAERAVA